ncbi:MAG: hypothetical protein J6Z00_03210 [Clostridia bacterium]|nr:hypothetical protein [Clostridia bacterium]
MLKTEEMRRRSFLLAVACQVLWGYLFYIPCAFSWVIWLPLQCFAGVTTFFAFQKASRTPRVLWIIGGVFRWFALLWGGYELISIGYDAISQWDLFTKVNAIFYMIATVMLPSMAVSVFIHKGRTEGKYAVLCSAFVVVSALIAFVLEPLKVKSLYHLTDVFGWPQAVTTVFCILTALFACFVFFLSIMALPEKEETKS